MNEITRDGTTPLPFDRFSDLRIARDGERARKVSCARCGASLRLAFEGEDSQPFCTLKVEAIGSCAAFRAASEALARALPGRSPLQLRAAAKAWLIAAPAGLLAAGGGSGRDAGEEGDCWKKPWLLLASLGSDDPTAPEREAFWQACVLRRATAEDIPRLHDLVESAYRGERSRRGWTTEADLLDGQRSDASMLAELIEGEAQTVLLIERRAELLACAHLRREGETAWFGLFAVSPPWQRSGLGGLLLQAAELFARERLGCRLLKMKVISLRRELIAWYERRGYRLTGEKAPFPYGDERFGRPRRPDLEFVVLARGLR